MEQEQKDTVAYPVITDHTQLQFNRYYWIRHKRAIEPQWRSERCNPTGEIADYGKQLGPYWASPANHEHLFRDYEIRGPIPTPDDKVATHEIN